MVEIVDGPVPKYEQLAALLRQRIAAGEWAPGQAIPSETVLESEFGLARGTIRKAIAALRAEGAIVTTRGKGSYVSGQAPSQP
ncbi:GntR family transcriptional regulator [Actinomadura sp. CNU-125]|uniref:GntR family transcriptional regulator n=1 Tax=Actinomadura sp. CNU-125 TaxID=1904961 RepID=UPI0021CCE37A|nr:GntR family transcriptional regulator [Actinomadura sp. CNU-125]